MNKLLIVIFSYNRAMQLNTLLKSIQNSFSSINIDVVVLYNHDTEFCEGYIELKKRYQTANIKFIKETSGINLYSNKLFLNKYNLFRYFKYAYLRNPKSDFRNLLNKTLEDSNAEYISFLTDDSVFIKKVEVRQEILEQISNNPSKYSYSLRLGLDSEGLPRESEIDKGIIKWDFYKNSSNKDWKYPFSVDGHIYNKNFITRVLKKIIYVNPNSLENFVCNYIKSKKQLNEGYANQEIYMLSYPINMVQNVEQNEHMGVSVELLEEYFLKGYQLFYPIPNTITSFQQYPEILNFKKGNSNIEIKLR